MTLRIVTVGGLEPELLGQSYELDPDGTATLGRDHACELVVRHATVSRRHAALVWDEHGLVVRNLSTRSATFVEGQRLDHGDAHRPTLPVFHLQLGGVLLEVSAHPPTSPFDEPLKPAYLLEVGGSSTAPTLRLLGHELRLAPGPSRLLACLAQHPGSSVPHHDLEAAVWLDGHTRSSGCSLAQPVTYARNAILEAFEDGVDPTALFQSLFEAGCIPSVDVSPRALVLALIRNVRGHGYCLQLAGHQVRVNTLDG